MLILLATAGNRLVANDQTNTNGFVSYMLYPHLDVSKHRYLMWVGISAKGEMMWTVYDRKAIENVGPVLLSNSDFSNLCWHVDHLLATVPPHFYGGGGNGWWLSIKSTNGAEWFAGARERDKSEDIKRFSTLLEVLSLRYIREPLEQKMPVKRCCKMEFALKRAGVIGLIGLVVGFFVWKKRRRKDTATPTTRGN
jgi:hypothetical protein